MSITVRSMLFDCENEAQAKHLAAFWSAALGVDDTTQDGVLQVALRQGAEDRAAWFTSRFRAGLVSTPRLQMLFDVADGTLAQEVERLVELGAEVIEDHRLPGHHGVGWVVLRDPIGNAFRVQSGAEEIAAHEAVLSGR